MSGQYNRQWPNGRNQYDISQDDMAELRESFEQKRKVSVCIGCGCDDNHACLDESSGQPCHWVRVDREEGIGVCSACPDHVERWDSGDRKSAAPAK